MDDIVHQAMLKWPQVPDCYGWLHLDARGDWHTAPNNLDTRQKSRIYHPALVRFIQRNYTVDAEGSWYFQNGPQRVFVELAVAPWILRVQANGEVYTHTKMAFHFTQLVVDENGYMYLAGELGLGLIHSLDTYAAFEYFESGVWTITMQQFASIDLPHIYGFVKSPGKGRLSA
ncbi:MAG: DUF2946 family protein [Gammaproteobacteria bacterium]|nr:DUF2946 family protein [Gammaproteobacteria bacterium]